VNGVPPLIHSGDKLLAEFQSQRRTKCDKIFGYSFVVTATYHERNLLVDEQRLPQLGTVVKNELKEHLFRKLSAATSPLPSELLSGVKKAPSNQGNSLSYLLSESWNCEGALSLLRRLYCSSSDAAVGSFLVQTLLQVPLNYDSDTLTSLSNYHSTSLPQLHLCPARSFGARISENSFSFVANPNKEGLAAFAMTEEVFLSGSHEFSVTFDPDASHSSQGTGAVGANTNCSFGIGIASSSAVDLGSDGIFLFSSDGEVKCMGSQSKHTEPCSPPCIGLPICVTLNMTVPSVSISQCGRVLIHQNLPQSLVSAGACLILCLEPFSETENLVSCRATIAQNHTPDSSALSFVNVLCSVLSHKLTSELSAAPPDVQSIRSVLVSNIEDLKRTCAMMLRQIPETDTKRRAFWLEISGSPSRLQLLFLHSCLRFPNRSPAFSRYLPLIKACFDSAFSQSAWVCTLDNFEIQLVIVLVAVSSHPPNKSPCTLSGAISELPTDAPFALCLRQSIIDSAASDKRPHAFLSQALKFYANIQQESEALPGDAIVLRAVCERAKNEVARSTFSQYFSEGNPESGAVLESFFSQLNSDSGALLPPLSAVFSAIPSRCVLRIILSSFSLLFKKLLTGQCTYSQGVIEFVTYTLCSCSRGSFAASRRALKLVHSAISSVSDNLGLNVIEVPQAAVSSVCPPFAAVLNMNFGGCPVPSFVNVGWAVVAARHGCVRISVASACVLCSVVRSNGCLRSVLSQKSGIPDCVAKVCIRTLSQLGLVKTIDAHGEHVVAPTDLCSVAQFSGRFEPVFESLHESEFTSECNLTDVDYISIVQAVLATLPQTAYIEESTLVMQCCDRTQAAPGKIAHVLAYLESKGLIVRNGDHIASMSPHLEPAASQHATRETRIPFDLPSCVLQLVIAIPSFQEPFRTESSVSNSVCIPRSQFETFLGQSFSHILPVTGVDQLQLSDRFIECNACVASLLFSLRNGDAFAPMQSSGSEFLVTKGFCPICLEDDVDILCPACGHGACFICWEGYVGTALQDNNTQTVNQRNEDRLHITKLKCIADHSCDTPLSVAFLSKVCPLAASSMVQLLQKSMCRSILSASPCIVQCQFCDFVLVAPNELCEALCSSCGRVKAAGDFKRNSPDQNWISHPNLKSGDLATWDAINQQGSVERYELMRFKKCPRCGAATTRCGCEDGKVMCDGLERCPNERCDQCPPPLHGFALALDSHLLPQHDVRQLQLQLVCFSVCAAKRR
jgi:hypothetical protein